MKQQIFTTRQSIFYSIFIAIVSYSVFFSLFYSENVSSSIISVLLLFIIYLPFFITVGWLGYLYLIPMVLIGLLISAIIDDYVILSIFCIVFIIPAILMQFIYEKSQKILYVISAITIYISLVVTILLLIYSSIISTVSINDNLYEMIYFVALTLNQHFKENNIIDEKLIIKTVEILSFTIPSLVGILVSFIAILNYKIYLLIARDSAYKEQANQESYLPNLHTYIFILLAFFSVIVHYFLDNYQNLYYISYNVMFILWFAYLYSGANFINLQISKNKSIITFVLFIILFIILFFEMLVIITFIGLVKEIRSIGFKRGN